MLHMLVAAPLMIFLCVCVCVCVLSNAATEDLEMSRGVSRERRYLPSAKQVSDGWLFDSTG